MKNIFSLFLIITILVLCNKPTGAQPRIRHIGILGATSATDKIQESRLRNVLLGLRALGYVEGQNIVIHYRLGKGDRTLLASRAAELVRREISLIVALGTNSIEYAMQATKTIPIIMVDSGNALSRGYVKTLSEPGGNVTGVSSFLEGEDAKRIELFKETILRSLVLRSSIRDAEKTASSRTEQRENDWASL